MDGAKSRFVGMLLAVALSGAIEPAALLAQQAPAQQTSPTPDAGTPSQTPAAPSPDATAPSQTPTTPSPDAVSPNPQEPAVERQQQEDKASQDLLNGSRENGTQLPESPDSTRAREEAARKAAQEQNPPGEPTGTAAAPAGVISGSVASRPAGAAIAPAKQRQVRSFLIKLGVIAGAGVALGTVYALSRGSSSSPPGAR